MKPKTIKLKRGDSDVVRLLKAFRYILEPVIQWGHMSIRPDKKGMQQAKKMVLEINEVIKKIG